MKVFAGIYYSYRSRDSSFGITTRPQAARSGFDSRQGLGIFLFATASRPAVRPTQPPIQWVPGVTSTRVKWLGHEAEHSAPSSAEVKNAWSYTSTPPIRLHGLVLSYAQGQLYLFSTLVNVEQSGLCTRNVNFNYASYFTY
jgi:hypothetical protein